MLDTLGDSPEYRAVFPFERLVEVDVHPSLVSEAFILYTVYIILYVFYFIYFERLVEADVHPSLVVSLKCKV